MPDSPRKCVVVSSNRFNDVGPYSSLVYRDDPDLWGAVFPWEFPQNGTKEQEERFLRAFFSESEIHMQGGADAPGNGFRFLKQVWYCNALWNLRHRVPAVESWYWQQPDSMIHLNDPKINEYFFKPDVQPATFFKQAELNMYGEKFLRNVIPRIQQTAKALLGKQQAEKQAASINNTVVSKDSTVNPAHNVKVAQSAPSGQHEFLTTDTSTHYPIQSNGPVVVPSHMPQSAPLPTNTEPIRPHIMTQGNTEPSVPPDPQFHQRKRGNSGSRRFNNRSGNFQGRQFHPSGEHDRNKQPLFSPPYGPPAAPAYPQSRGPSGGPIDFMPHGQPMHSMSPQFQYVPGQFGHAGNVPHSMHFVHGHGHGPQPIYYSTNAFPDRTNSQFSRQVFRGEQHPPVFDGSHGIRGGQRRNSYSSRGGKPRGFNGGRGRGSRGSRNSFAASDQEPFFPQGMNMNQRQFNEFPGSDFAPKGRRGSIFGEQNWRSSSDHPQTQRNDRPLKENIIPRRDTSALRYHPSGTMAYPDFGSDITAAYHHKPPFKHSVPAHVANSEAQQWTGRRVNVTPEMTCNRDWIGPECTFATKFIAFDIPDSMPIFEIIQHFSQYAHVVDAKRVLSKNAPEKGTVVFLLMANHMEARKLLETKPLQWPDGRVMRVEVAREFWDPDHHLFQRNQYPHISDTTLPEADKNYTDSFGTPHVSAILQRREEDLSTPRSSGTEKPKVEEAQSEETTPTPSGASTPKKKNKKNKSRGGKKKDDLRKTSLAASVDQILRNEKDEDKDDAASIVTTISREDFSKVDLPIALNTKNVIDTALALKQRTGSAQTEVQTSCEPGFTPTENIETRLPIPWGMRTVRDIQSAATEDQQSTSTDNEAQMSSELIASPADSIITELPIEDKNESQPFREDKKAEEKEKTQSDVNESAVDAQDLAVLDPSAQITGTPSKPDDDHADDSFHTASASPDSSKAMDSEKGDNTNGVESEPAPTEAAQKDDISSYAEGASEVTMLTPLSKDNKKVPIPQPSSKPKVVLSTASTKAKSEESQPEPSSTSSYVNVPHTPAFITAPNTPAVLQEAAMEEVPKPTVPPSKKNEKPKGPAQTESLSLFGKKKEKKPKPKKGTLRGKPNQSEMSTSDIASASSSRVVSGAATPNVEATTQGLHNTAELTKGGETMLRTDSKYSDDCGKQSNIKQEAVKTPTKDTSAPAVAQEETPSKRQGKLGTILSSFFGGGQQSQAPSNETTSDEVASSKNWLTGSKAQDRPQGVDIEPTNTLSDAEPARATVDVITNRASESTIPYTPYYDAETVHESGTATDNTSRDDDIGHREADEVGLGISNVAAEQPADEEPKPRPKKNNRNKKARKRKPPSDVDTIEVAEHSTPTTPAQPTPKMFRFGESASPATNPDDGGSDASSHTMSVEKLTPDPQSPIVSTPAKKFLSKAPGSDHLLAAKQPALKNKKRVPSSKAAEIDADEEVMVIDVLDLNNNSDTSEQDSQNGNNTPSSDGGTKRPERLYVYVGPGLRDDTDGSNEDIPREKVQQLALEELKRKHVTGEW